MMIEFFYWSTPNGDKVLILLEELGLNYELKPVNILQGEQYEPDFLKVSPNNKIPAVRIGQGTGAEQQTIFESGAIMLHIAEAYGEGSLIPENKKLETLQWLFWQVGGLGPMAGQTHHFNFYAPEKIPYAVERYQKESRRLYGVLDKQLEGQDYIVGEFSIADIACYPWIECHKLQNVPIENYPNIQRWLDKIRLRPSVQKAKDINKQYSQLKFSEEHRQHFFR